MLFKDIPGLDSVKQQLINAVDSDHVAHAQLFFGSEGSANMAMALAFATYLNCENRAADDACGACSACVKNLKYIHPDLHFVFPTAATPKIKREDAVSDKFLVEWRSFLQQSPFGNVTDWSFHFGWENKQVIIPRMESRGIIQKLSLKAFEGKFKIMVIWQPELMNASSANGILKILEEPPERTIFLLVTSDANKLLTTILSRTQMLKIPAFEEENIKSYLDKKVEIEESQRVSATYLSEGNMRLALSLAEGNINEVQASFKDWMRICYNWDFQSMTKMGDAFQKGGKEYQKSLLNAGTKVMRDTLVNQFEPEMVRVTEEEMDFVQKFGQVFTPEKIGELIPKLEEAHYHIERNGNPKILFLDLSLNIARIARSKN